MKREVLRFSGSRFGQLACVLALTALACSSGADSKGARVRVRPSPESSSVTREPHAEIQVGGEGDRDASPPTSGPALEAQWWVANDILPEGGVALYHQEILGGEPQLVASTEACEGLGILRVPGTYLLQKFKEQRPEISSCGWDADPHISILRPDGSVVADLGRSRNASISPDGKYLAWSVPDGVQTCSDEEPDCEIPEVTSYIAPISNLTDRKQLDKIEGVRNVRWFGREAVMALAGRSVGHLFDLSGRKQRISFGGRLMDTAPSCGCFLVVSEDLKTLELKRLDLSVIWERSFDWEVQASISNDGGLAVVSEIEPISLIEVQARLSIIDSKGRTSLISGAVPTTNLMVTSDGILFGFSSYVGSDTHFTLCSREKCSSSFPIGSVAHLLQMERKDYK